MSQVAVSPEELVARVRQYQGSNGYTDQQMAELIGCSRPVYNRTIHGCAFHPLLNRYGENAYGAYLSCARREPGGCDQYHQARLRLPAGI